MPTFAYAGRDGSGAVVRGWLEAEDDARALARLREQGLFVTSLQVKTARRGRGGIGGKAEVALVTRHLAMLIGAGLPVLPSLEAVAEQSETVGMRVALGEMVREIEEGRSLSATLGRRSHLFDQAYVGIVRNGEASGRLDQALDRLASYLERDLELQRRVRDALIYPALVLALAAVVMAVFMTTIIPAFDKVYRSAQAELPPLTRALLTVSALFRGNLPVLAIVAGSLVLRPVRRAVKSALAGPALALARRIPQAHELAETVTMARFTHSLSTMMQSGVPLLSAIEVAGQAAGTADFQPVTETLITQIGQGVRLSDAMRSTDRFPPMVTRIVDLGEQSGRLDVMLERAAAMLDSEFDLRMRRLLTFLEPALTLVLGGVIGVILMALYLPIFGLSRAIVR